MAFDRLTRYDKVYWCISRSGRDWSSGSGAGSCHIENRKGCRREAIPKVFVLDGEKPKAVENGRGSSMGWLIACEQARFFLRLSFLAFPPSAISQTPHAPRRQLQCVFTYSLRCWSMYASIFTTVICGPPPLSFGNNYRVFPLRLTLRHNTRTHHFVSWRFGKSDNAAHDVQDRYVYAAASNPIGLRLVPGTRVCRVNAPRAVRCTGKRRQLFVLIIRNKEKASPPIARIGKRLSSRRSGVKPEASNAVERSQLRRNDDVMDDRNAEAPRQATICEACCYPSNMSTVFFVNTTGKGSEDGGGSWWSRSARRAMSDSRNAVKAIPRNYATSVHGDAAPQAIPAIQFLNTSLSPVFILLSNRPSEPSGEPSWLTLMDDEGKERVIAERLSLSDSRVLSFGRNTHLPKNSGDTSWSRRPTLRPYRDAIERGITACFAVYEVTVKTRE
ncbi:hypothetical protein G5I_13886 [Acromyrmex echinatior]|uniref:Uncharacterized protein n=1 Tax=Acromyrmex echinatior TaxID=103372 RepID=F4X677_ACREC|nr:hypothetical protein G5I_13886 [Acromyrmex echinatior]